MRYSLIILGAIIFNFFTFYLIVNLVNDDTDGVLENKSTKTVDLVVVEKQKRQQQARTELEKPDIKMAELPQAEKIALPEIKLGEFEQSVSITAPTFEMPHSSTPALGDVAKTSADAGLVPTLRIEPRYPRKAAQRGIEGWVKVKFTVLTNGSVTNAEVVDAKPKRTFDRAALNAIERWKFQPKVVDGKAEESSAQQLIEFKLAK